MIIVNLKDILAIGFILAFAVFVAFLNFMGRNGK
jgi:hypothetical protein